MKLHEVLTDHAEFDKQRATRNRVWALKAQQAIAECDGWTSVLAVPKPMDPETGELFHWTGVATHEPDGNTVRYIVHVDKIIDRNNVDGDLVVGPSTPVYGPKRTMIIDLNLPLDVMAAKFEAAYESMLVTVANTKNDHYVAEIEDRFVNEWEDGGEEAVRAAAEEEVFKPDIAKWLTDYENQSNGIVNSKELAAQLVDRLKRSFNAAVDDWIDELKARDERRENDEERNGRWR